MKFSGDDDDGGEVEYGCDDDEEDKEEEEDNDYDGDDDDDDDDDDNDDDDDDDDGKGAGSNWRMCLALLINICLERVHGTLISQSSLPNKRLSGKEVFVAIHSTHPVFFSQSASIIISNKYQEDGTKEGQKKSGDREQKPGRCLRRWQWSHLKNVS